MPDWLDTDSFATPARGPYRFPRSQRFWAFLAQQGRENRIASPEMVLNELLEGNDQLKVWAKNQRGALFRPPDNAVQAMVTQIATAVANDGKYAPHQVNEFLSKADPWVIAHAKIDGGRIVTFEARVAPNSRKVKIPNVADDFGVICINLWDLLTELGWDT